MNTRKALFSAAAAGLLTLGGGWFLIRSRASIDSPAKRTRGGGESLIKVRPPRPLPANKEAQSRAESSQEVNSAHQKMFLEEQLRRHPKHTPILLQLAQAERSSGDLRGARQHLEQAFVADPKQVDARLELSLVSSELGDLAAAEQQNREILRIHPDQPDALYNLGALAANRGDSKHAREFWTTVIRIGAATEAGAKSRKAIERLEAVTNSAAVGAGR